MTTLLRRLTLVLALALALATPTAALAAPSATPAPGAGTPEVELGNGPIPAGKAGAKVSVKLPLINRGDGAALDILITPKPSVDPATFPFTITRTDYTVDAGDLAADSTTTVDLGTFTLRSGLATGYYAMPLSIQYGDGTERTVIERTIFVRVEGVAKPTSTSPTPVTTAKPQTVEVIVKQQSTGNSSGSGVDLSSSGSTGGTDTGTETGTGASTDGSAPRVMLTSFTSSPYEVIAGETFGVTFSLTNMSSKRSVGNIKVTVASADGSVLPTSGASSVYIASIKAGRSASRSLEFRALPTLEERPYQLSLSIEYEDNSTYQALSAEETVAILVKQRVRAETSGLEVVPEMITVGQDASVSLSLQNLGKVPLYNVKASVAPGQPVTGDEVFVGNVEPGTSGTIDMIVHAEGVPMEPVALAITYEDASGNKSTIDETVELMVTDAGEMEVNPDEVIIEEAGPGLLSMLLWPLLALLLIAGAIVAAVVVTRRRRRRREAELAQHLEQADTEQLYPEDPR